VVETRVTQIIEDAVSGIEGVQTLESRSRNGRSEVTIEFTLSRDIESAANDVRDGVSRVFDRLPDEADAPQVEKVESDAEVIMWLNLNSERLDTLELSDYAERYVVDRSGQHRWRGASSHRWDSSVTRCASGWIAMHWLHAD
jgi:multidrug efflux pump